MQHNVIRVKTGIRSGMTESIPPDLGEIKSTTGAFRWADSGGGYYGALNSFPGERVLRRWALETQAWVRSPRARLKDMIFPAQKVLRRDRYWELDTARGVSVVLMLAQHFIVAGLSLVSRALAVAAYGFWTLAKTWVFLGLLSYFAGVAFTSPRAPRPSRRLPPGIAKTVVSGIEFLILSAMISWLVTGGSGATGFMIIMGISLTISFARSKKNRPEQSYFPKILKRSSLMFLSAGLLSVFSFFVRPEAKVTFGILHMLAASLLLAFPFLSLPAGAGLLAGLALIVFGANVRTDNPALSWLLINPAGVSALDYFSLLPGLGAVLLGVALGKVLYPDGKREIPVPDLSEKNPVEFLSWVGENALPIFMLQEPLFFLGKARMLA